MKPVFSIIIPTHNGEGCLKKCLDSVYGQHFQNFEVIVICDACTDKTAEIARSYEGCKVFEVNYERDGLARNLGLDQAEGEWVLFLDHDDWWLHEYVLNLLVDQIIQYPHMDELFFSFIWKGTGYMRQTERQSYIACWCKLYRRTYIGNTRFSDKQYWSDVDFDSAMRSKQGWKVYLDNPLYYYNFMYPGSINDIANRSMSTQ